MTYLKNNMPWIAPTGAVILSAAFLSATGVFDSGGAPAQQTSAISTFSAPLQAPVETVTVAPAVVAAPAAKETPATEAGATAAIDGGQIIAAINRARSGTDDADVTRSEDVTPSGDVTGNEAVTRNAPVALLDTDIDEAAPTPVALPVPALAAITPGASPFDFSFAAAQAQLTSDISCIDDLSMLAGMTQIYFPSGGLTAEEDGLIKARIIGQLARTCPGYLIQVEGHSDPSGNSDANLVLSKQRAEVVISRLAAAGIDTSNFVAIGKGDKSPSGVTGPEGAAYYDRRVEFSVVEQIRTASAAGFTAPASWASPPPACAASLEEKVAQLRLFYAPRAITVLPNELEAVYALAHEVSRCEGVRLRVVGHHSDDFAARENIETGRLRALVLMGSLVAAGFESEELLTSAPSFSVPIEGQPGLPRSRVDFQIIAD